MNRSRVHRAMYLVPALALLGLGCGSKDQNVSSDGGGKESSGTVVKPPASKREPLAFTARSTVKGKVTLVGTPPEDLAKADTDLQDRMKKKDEKCVTGATPEETSQFDWRLGDGNGVANVAVWLRPPDGHYFKLEDKDQKADSGEFPAEVVLDQPHCAFEPHVFMLYPSYYDGKSQKTTHQIFKVKNSAPMDHNTKWSGGKNGGDNKTLSSGKDLEVTGLKPDDEHELDISCNIHDWMRAYAWILDHPFAAVTDKNGNYEIKNVPAGVKVRIVAWHEKKSFLNGGAKGEEYEIKEGESNTKDFQIKGK